MHEIAVAGLEVDHVEAGCLGIAGRRNVAVDEPLHVVVVQQARSIRGVDTVAAVEQRVVVGDPRLPAHGRGLGESSRMRELQGDDEIVGAAMTFAVGLAEG